MRLFGDQESIYIYINKGTKSVRAFVFIYKENDFLTFSIKAEVEKKYLNFLFKTGSKSAKNSPGVKEFN